MIVLLNVIERSYVLNEGDTFNLYIEDEKGKELIIREEINTQCVLNFIATFVFAKEDGSCNSFNFSGFFGNSNDLPLEIKNATRIEDLSASQLSNFKRTAGLNL